jgi:hypothetical protein
MHKAGATHSLARTHHAKVALPCRMQRKPLLSRPRVIFLALFIHEGGDTRRAAFACYCVRRTHVWLSFPKSNTLAARCWARCARPSTRPPCSRIRPSSPLLTCLESEMASFQPLILLSCSLILSPNVFHPPNGPPAAAATTAILYPRNFLLFHACAKAYLARYAWRHG